MFRSLTALALVSCLPVQALAERPSDAERQARVERALEAMPSRAEVDEIVDAMPNFTGALIELQAVAMDQDNQATLASLLTRLETEFSGVETELADGGVPDINGLMRRMMYLTSDREFMGSALDLMFQVQDAVEIAIPEEPAGLAD